MTARLPSSTAAAAAAAGLSSAAPPPDRVLQASFLIPSYQKALPHALLHECTDDYRLRKIQATCSCRISWGRLPPRLAERYCLLQMEFDPKRGNYLGALNLLRQYFLGHTALIQFQQTLLRPNGSQVTKKFPTSVDDCRLLMPRCDRFGRTVVDLAAAVAATAEDRAAAVAIRDEACRRLADRLMESGLRCQATHAAFVVECEAASRRAADDESAAEAAAAAALAAEAELACAAETVAQCELGRVCVCALVEAAEATRLLEQLEGRRLMEPQTEHRQHWSQSPSRRRIDFRLSPTRHQHQQQQQDQHQQQQQDQQRLQDQQHQRQQDQQRLQDQQHQRQQEQQQQQQQLQQQEQHQRQHQRQHQQSQLPLSTMMRQANNHHRPVSRGRPDHRRCQQQQPQLQQQPQPQQQRPRSRPNRQHPEESCATTLADVEAITFAESEYVDNKAQTLASRTAAAAAASSSARPPTLSTAPSTQLPESLLLCGIQPSAASALSALDRSDRRLKAVERRTGCRLELRERRCYGAAAGLFCGDVGGCGSVGGGGSVAPTSQQVSYALQVVPLGPDARPRGCANMLRTLLHRLDPSCRVCVVSASDAAAAAAATGDIHGGGGVGVGSGASSSVPRLRRSPLRRSCRSKSVTPSQHQHQHQLEHQRQHQNQHRSRRLLLRRRSQQPPPPPLPPQQHPTTVASSSSASMILRVQSAAVAAAASRLLRVTVADCLLGVSASAAAVAGSAAFRARLELRRDAIRSDALACVLRSLTATEADARLLAEAIDSNGADSNIGGGGFADDSVDAFGIVRDAVRRTLMSCAAERRVGVGLLGAFACLEAASSSSSAETALTQPALLSSSTLSPTTLSARRRLARLTQACWERLCGDALAATGAGVGVGVLLEAAVADAAAEAANDELRPPPATVLQQQQWRQHRCRSSSVVQASAVRRLLAGQLNSAIGARVALAALLTRLAGRLVTEQVRSACLKAQLMMRLRLRDAAHLGKQ